VDRRFRGAYCLHLQGDDIPDDGRSTHILNVGPHQWDYTALLPRRLNFILAALRTWNLNRNSPVIDYVSVDFTHSHRPHSDMLPTESLSAVIISRRIPKTGAANDREQIVSVDRSNGFSVTSYCIGPNMWKSREKRSWPYAGHLSIYQHVNCSLFWWMAFFPWLRALSCSCVLQRTGIESVA
jgi:hypothetical protein